MKSTTFTHSISDNNGTLMSVLTFLAPPYDANTLLSALIRLDKDSLWRQDLEGEAHRNEEERFYRKLG